MAAHATHVQIAANLLRNAATFFRDIGGQNPGLNEQMGMNAQTFETVADLLESDPMGMMGEEPSPSGDDAKGDALSAGGGADTSSGQ